MTTTNQIQLGWGYKQNAPEGAQAAWGARTLCYQTGEIDILWNRTDCDGPQEAKDRLLAYLNDLGMGVWKDPASELLRTYRMKTREAEEFTLYEDDTVVFLANTNASAGYLYVTAYLKAGA